MFAIAECSASGEIEVGRVLPVIFTSEEKARSFLEAFVRERLCQDGASALAGASHGYQITPVTRIAPGKCPFQALSGCLIRTPL